MLKSKIESLLFISVKPVSARQLAKVLEVEVVDIEIQVKRLMQEYSEQRRGINIIQIEQAESIKYQMATSSKYSELVKRFTKQELSSDLTKPALETLTIIAYKGPITKPELELIRGVNCSMILRNLLIRNLIEEQNDSQKGLPAYNVTGEFLQWLGVSSIKELPDYELMKADENLNDLLESKSE